MKARICDLCGSIIHKGSDWGEVKYHKHYTPKNLIPHREETESYELCEQCQKAMISFIRNHNRR